jgi:hypothetical protein
MVSTDAPLAAFGGGASLERLTQSRAAIGDAVSAFGSEVKKAEIKAKRDADELRVMDEASYLTTEKNKIYSEAELYKGKSAVDSDFVNLSLKSFDKSYEARSKALADNDQRNMLKRVWANDRLELQDKLEKHHAREAAAYTEQVGINGTATRIDDTRKNPYKAAENRKSIEQTIVKIGESLGKGPEWVKSATENAVSDNHIAAVDALIDSGRVKEARYYYDKNIKEIIQRRNEDGETRLSKTLNHAEVDFRAKQNAEEIVLKFGEERQGEAYDFAKDKDDTGRTAGYVDRIYKERKEIDYQKHASVFNEAQRYVESGKPVPLSMSSTLTTEENKSLERRRKQVESGAVVNTDVDTYYSLKALAAEKPNEFLKQQLGKYSDKLANAERKELDEIQQGLRNQDRRTKEKLDGYLTDRQIVNGALEEVKIKPNSPDATLFHSKIDEMVRRHQAETGNKASQEDIRKFSDELLIQGEISFGRDRRLFQVKPGQVFELDVDRATRKKIAEALEASGKKPTEQNIIRLYSEYQRAQKAKTKSTIY